MAVASELPITSNASAMDMAQTIFGEGVSVVSASYSGDRRSSGTYSDGDNVAPGVTPADTGVLLSTGNLRNFTKSSGDPNTSSSTSSNMNNGIDNDADFNALAGANTYDASILDIDFIPDGDTMSLQFVFSSDEYPEYAGSIYNDAVGVWVNGNPVDLAIGNGDTSVGNVNQTSNENLYVDNTGDDYNTEMDGFTVTMRLVMPVIAGQVNSIRIGIADVGDANYDSTLLIAGDSAQTAVIAQDDSVDVAPNGSSTIDVVANDSGPGSATLYVTHINGIEVSAGDSITLTTGQVVTLNANGTLTIDGDADEESVNFSYTVGLNGSAVSDTAFVTVNQVPCFVSGTMIATPDGEVPVEEIESGDLVLTKDNGPQPVRWAGVRRVQAQGAMAPIRFAAGAFGAHRALMVSPQHRVLIHDSIAELLFGEAEVLVAAKDLVNDRNVRPVEGGEVEYVHLLFDCHQVIYSEGLATESFLPGPQITRELDRAVLEEIQQIFPELDPVSGTGFPHAARRMLKHHEARLILSGEREVAA